MGSGRYIKYDKNSSELFRESYNGPHNMETTPHKRIREENELETCTEEKKTADKAPLNCER